MNDHVNHPKHYDGPMVKIECIDIKRHLKSNFADAFKYVWRHGEKDKSQTIMEKHELNDFERYALWWLSNDNMVTLYAGDKYISEFDVLVKHGYANREIFESRNRVYTLTKAGDQRATEEFGGLS